MGGEEKGQKEESFPLFSFFLLLEFCAEVLFYFLSWAFDIEKKDEGGIRKCKERNNNCVYCSFNIHTKDEYEEDFSR